MSTRNDIITDLIDSVHSIKDSDSYDCPLISIEEYVPNYLTLEKSKFPLLMVIDQHNDEISVQDMTHRRCALDINFHYVTRDPKWRDCRQNMNQFVADLREWLDSGPSISNILDIQWIQSSGISVEPGSSAQSYMGEVANLIRVIYTETRGTSHAAGSDTYGTDYIETAKDKIVAQLNALKTSIASDDPTIANVYGYHNVANMGLNAVTVDLEETLPESEAIGSSGLSVEYPCAITVRVHTGYVGTFMDTDQTARLLAGCANYLQENKDLSDGYRLLRIEDMTINDEFDESQTYGGQLTAVVNKYQRHTQS